MSLKNEVVLTCLTKKKYKAYRSALSSVEMYCKKYDLDLEILETPKYSPRNFYDKFYFYELLKKYHRVLVLDSDVLITPTAPNIFEKYNKYENFYALHINSEDGDFNEGVFIVSRTHMDRFKMFETHLLYTKKNLGLSNKTYLNKMVKHHNIEVTNIDKKFNYMCDDFTNDKNRFKSFFIHYENAADKIDLISSDFKKLYS